MLLNIEKQQAANGVVVLKISGRISLGRDSQQVEWKMDELLKENARKVVLDLTKVSHIDSTGIGIIVSCSGKLRGAGGDLRLSGAAGLVEQVLKLTQVNNIVKLFPTAAAAAESFKAGSA